MHFPALLEELDRIGTSEAPERRGEILLRIADLFSSEKKAYSAQQIGMFDDVFVRLVRYIETTARANLAARLADEPHAPRQISCLLANDDEIGVAGPMLERSQALDEATLVAVARSKGQPHLLALSRRDSLDEAVTDLIVERGDADVVLNTVHNKGARFSQLGFQRLVDRSQNDDDLASSVGLRPDLPRAELMRLLVRASHQVRSRLQTANPVIASAVQEAIDSAATAVFEQADTLIRDYEPALAELCAEHAAGALTDADVASFATGNDFEKTVAALSLLSGLQPGAVERALCHERTDAVLVLAKAAGLSWPTVKSILRLRRAGRDMSPGEYERCATSYAGLKEYIARNAIEIKTATRRFAFSAA
jgi:uncharacterized protein (DUF2336 family)